MTTGKIHGNPTRREAPSDNTPRLRLEPTPDYLDVTWWPRSADLVAELPDLMAVLAERTGPISRIVYDRESWTDVPRQLAVGDHTVPLDPYTFELGNTMYVYSTGGDVIVLRVIAASTGEDTSPST